MSYSRRLAVPDAWPTDSKWSVAVCGVSRSPLISFRGDGRQSVDRSQLDTWGLAVQALVHKRCQLERDSLTNERRIGVMRSGRRQPVTNRAAAFCTDEVEGDRQCEVYSSLVGFNRNIWVPIKSRVTDTTQCIKDIVFSVNLENLAVWSLNTVACFYQVKLWRITDFIKWPYIRHRLLWCAVQWVQTAEINYAIKL